jgi:hypothetical protein
MHLMWCWDSAVPSLTGNSVNLPMHSDFGSAEVDFLAGANSGGGGGGQVGALPSSPVGCTR